MLEHAWPTMREAGHSLSFGTDAEVLGPPPPECGEGSGPGLASGGTLTSIGSLQRSNGAEGITPLRALSLLLKASTNSLLLALI